MLTIVTLAVLAVQAAPSPDSVYRLPIRVHLLSSPQSTALSTTRTEPDVLTLLATANAIWRQADIEWMLESVVREEAPNGALFERLLVGENPRPGERLIWFAPRDKLLTPGWNLFLIRDFGRVGGGVFYTELDGIILAERGFGFELPPDGRGGATLAHELGHSLGLFHVLCDSTRNILAIGCWDPSQRSSLTPAQIRTSRKQAATGRPSPETFQP